MMNLQIFITLILTFIMVSLSSCESSQPVDTSLNYKESEQLSWYNRRWVNVYYPHQIIEPYFEYPITLDLRTKNLLSGRHDANDYRFNYEIDSSLTFTNLHNWLISDVGTGQYYFDYIDFIANSRITLKIDTLVMYKENSDICYKFITDSLWNSNNTNIDSIYFW